MNGAKDGTAWDPTHIVLVSHLVEVGGNRVSCDNLQNPDLDVPNRNVAKGACIIDRFAVLKADWLF